MKKKIKAKHGVQEFERVKGDLMV